MNTRMLPSIRRNLCVAPVLLGLAAAAFAAQVPLDQPPADQFTIKNHPTSLTTQTTDQGAVLSFTHEKPASVVAIISPKGQTVVSTAEELTVDVKLDETTSFGLFLRASADDKDAYLVLLNSFPKNGGMLRVFRTPVWPLENPPKNQLAAKNVPLPVGRWYRLHVTTENTGSAVVIRAELFPAPEKASDPTPSARPLVDVTAQDTATPLADAGKIALRFFSGAQGKGTIQVRRLEISPDPAEKK